MSDQASRGGGGGGGAAIWLQCLELSIKLDKYARTKRERKHEGIFLNFLKRRRRRGSFKSLQVPVNKKNCTCKCAFISDRVFVC